MSKLLIVCGPTATGKTKLAVTLAKQCNGELVSADSRQVYKGMDIGTGKDIPTNNTNKNSTLHLTVEPYHLFTYDLGGVPIWLYDIVQPNEDFSVFHFQKLALRVIGDIHKRGKLPIVVGGTGLYIQSLMELPAFLHIPPNTHLRNELNTFSLQELQQTLQHTNEKVYTTMNNSDRQNPRRLIRKIELQIYEQNNNNSQAKENTVTFDTKCIGLKSDLQSLYHHIDQRVDRRVQQGVEKEIQTVLASGYTWDLPALTGLGYRQWHDYFEKKEDRESVIQKWKFAEHAYARKQMTWFRKQPAISWYDIRNQNLTEEVKSNVSDWLKTDIIKV